MVADDGETPNILLKQASILRLQAQYGEASEILLRFVPVISPAVLRSFGDLWSYWNGSGI